MPPSRDKGMLYGGSDKARKLAFIAIFGTRVVIAYLFTPAPVSVDDEFQLL